MGANPSRRDLIRIVKDVFLTLLSMEVQEGGPAAETSWGPGVTASLHPGGSWSGAVLLQCELATACRFAAVLLGIERPVRADDDVKHAMGELVRMVAGSFQAVTGEESCLSLPTVVEDGDYRPHLPWGHPAARVDFVTPAGPLRVWLAETSSLRSSAPPTAPVADRTPT